MHESTGFEFNTTSIDDFFNQTAIGKSIRKGLTTYRKPNFLIFVRLMSYIMSHKPNAGDVGTLFDINV